MNSSDIKLKLGLRLKAFRIEQNLTQEQLSEIIDLKPANISNIEKGKAHPGFNTLCSLINKANVEPNYLFGFLRKNNISYNSSTLELIDIILSLPENQKQSLKNFLLTLK